MSRDDCSALGPAPETMLVAILGVPPIGTDYAGVGRGSEPAVDARIVYQPENSGRCCGVDQIEQHTRPSSTGHHKLFDRDAGHCRFDD